MNKYMIDFYGMDETESSPILGHENKYTEKEFKKLVRSILIQLCNKNDTPYIVYELDNLVEILEKKHGFKYLEDETIRAKWDEFTKLEDLEKEKI